MSAGGDVDSLVRSLFRVNDTFQLPDGEVEYRVSYGDDSKENFERLFKDLSAKGLTPWLSGSAGDCVLLVRKKQALPQVRSRIPIILALLTLVSVVVFSVIEGEVYQAFAPSISWYTGTVTFGACVIILIAVHEFGHRIAARRKGTAASVPYLIPGIPTVTAFLPTLGIVSPQREPAVNRDHLFDIAIAGPLAMFALSVILFLVGEFTAVQSTLQTQGTQAVNSYISVSPVNPSVIQYAIDAVISPFTKAPPSGTVSISAVSDASWVGFFLCFVSLFPMAFLDGGYISMAVFGNRATRITTYLGVLILIVFDTPYYWALGIVVLLLAGRPFGIQTYDEVSAVSSRKKMIFAVAILLALFSIPIPQNLATFPLP
jgi:membrane-associated protease RseP (regulator of RpoE activity)